MKFFFISLSALIISLIISCESNKNDETQINFKSFRQEFIKGKNSEQIRNDFNLASFETKQKLWIDKMDHLLTQGFNSNIKKNILILRECIRDFGNIKKYDNFGQTIINLSKQIPREDFEQMFTTLEDYEFNGSFKGHVKVSSKFISFISQETNPIKISEFRKRDCTCRWCFYFDKSFFSRDCRETAHGCGFLGLQSCIRYLNLREEEPENIRKPENIKNREELNDYLRIELENINNKTDGMENRLFLLLREKGLLKEQQKNKH